MELMSRSGRAHRPQDSTEGRAIRVELFLVTVLVALTLLLISFYLVKSSGTAGEQGKVDKSKYQAVFLNGGATSGAVAYTTYFGHITTLNDKYMVLQNVYYLTTDQTSTGTAANPQLTKLGCQQLHSPYDAMYINRSQVAFWENLQDSGKVVQAIKQFQQQNPNGPNCTATSSSTNSTTSTGTSGTSTQSTGAATKQ